MKKTEGKVKSEEVKGNIITLKKPGSAKYIDIDLDKLGKVKQREVERISKESRKGNIKITEDKGEVMILYPKRGGGFFSRKAKGYESGYVREGKREGSTLSGELRKMYPKIDFEEFKRVEEWIGYSLKVGIRPPDRWGALKPRWIKTMKIIYVSSYMDTYYSNYKKMPDIKSIRTLVNNLKSPNTDIQITNDMNRVRDITKVIYRDGELCAQPTVLYQTQPDIVPGFEDWATEATGKGKKKKKKTLKFRDVDTEFNNGGKYASILKINYEGESMFLFYTGHNTFTLTSNRADSDAIYKERLKELSQKLSISMQYPLEYIEWK